MKRLQVLFSLALFTLVATACDDDMTPLAPEADAGPGLINDSDTESPRAFTIADLVVDQATNPGADGRVEFTALLDAVLSADPAVLEALSGPGEFTVFAPTDAAFDALAESLAWEAQPDGFITNVLLYHVAEGELDSSAVLSRSTIRMLNGDFVTIDRDEVTINGASFKAVDIRTSNGIIHVIDQVLQPS